MFLLNTGQTLWQDLYKTGMNRLKKLNELQDVAVEAIMKQGGKGTVKFATGTGKTFIAFKFLYRLLRQGLIKKDCLVWFLAETTVRRDTLKEESDKFNEIYGVDPMSDFNIEFHCYQAKPKGNPVIIIADEIHFSLTKEYSKVFKNPHKYIIGLSATIPIHQKVHDKLTKGKLLQKIAPIAIELEVGEAIDMGILSPFTTTVINHTLNYQDKNLVDTSGKKEWYTSEYGYYIRRDRKRRDPKTDYKYKEILIRDMCRLLWNLPSKIEPARKLLKDMKGKTIIFATNLNILKELLDSDLIVSGEKSDEDNDLIIQNFNDDKITVIGSCKKLKQGITLEGVENCLILSYYKESWHTLQMIGRTVRFVEGKQAKLYIFRTEGTFETKWFENINKIYNEDGLIEKEEDLNIVANFKT
jgi:superfamily II DNA or RNA helicase